MLLFTVAAVVVVGLAVAGVYNKYIAPKAGLPSSLNDGKGNSGTIDGATGEVVVDNNVDLASFSFSVVDAANDDTVVTTAIPVGAIDAAGKERLKPSTSNTTQTITSIPERTVLSFYGGSSSYYLEPVTNRKIEVGDLVSMTARSVQTEANMLVTVYDDTGSNALSAGNSSQAEDYTMALGESQEKVVYIKLSNNAANAALNVKAICTGWTGTNMSSFEIQGSDWSEASVPDVAGDTGVTYYNGATSAATGEYKKCFVYKKGTDQGLMLEEWENTPLIKATVKAKDGKDPQDETGENVYFTIMDGAWARGSDGKGYFDFYQHDGDEGNVGLTETLSSPTGKQLGALIELS